MLHRLYTLPQCVRAAMPSWNSGEIVIRDGSQIVGQFKVTISPGGWRSIPGLQLFPFTTGSKPRFSIAVKRVDSKEKSSDIILRLIERRPPLDPPDARGLDETHLITSDPYEIAHEDRMVAQKGRHVFTVSISTYRGSSLQLCHDELDVLSFDAKDDDTVKAWLIGTVLAVAAIVVSGLFLAW